MENDINFEVRLKIRLRVFVIITMETQKQTKGLNNQYGTKRKVFKSNSITPQILATISNSIDPNNQLKNNYKINYDSNKDSVQRTLSLSNPPVKIQLPINVIEASSAENSPEFRTRSENCFFFLMFNLYKLQLV